MLILDHEETLLWVESERTRCGWLHGSVKHGLPQVRVGQLVSVEPQEVD